MLAVADRADHGDELALGHVRMRAPTDSTRLTTASTCSGVASSFMTIIIWTLDLSKLAVFESYEWYGARPAKGL